MATEGIKVSEMLEVQDITESDDVHVITRNGDRRYKLKKLISPKNVVGVKTSDGGETFNDTANNFATAKNAHAEGSGTVAAAESSHAQGVGSKTSNEAEHAQGKYNRSNPGTIHSVGVGTSNADRKNAVEVMKDGRVFILNVGGYDGTNPTMSKDVAKAIKEGGSGSGSDVPTSPGASIQSFTYDVSTNTLKLTDGNKTHTATIAKSSNVSDGLMSKEQHAELEKIKNRLDFNKPLVYPAISGTWTYYNQSNTKVSMTPSTAEYGYKAKFSGTWKWTAADGRKNPMRVVSAEFGNTLKGSGESSDTYNSPNYVESNQNISVTLYADKSGLVVSGTNVVAASGEDSASANTNPSFKHRIYYGATSSNIDETAVKALKGTVLQSGKGKTIDGVETTPSEKYVYAFPSVLGDLSGITNHSQGGASIILGFSNTKIDIDTGGGKKISYNVYVSNQFGPFAGKNKIQFS